MAMSRRMSANSIIPWPLVEGAGDCRDIGISRGAIMTDRRDEDDRSGEEAA